ncbi:hypothetical protein [Streptacidiphilus sp. EB129]|uniref:hypothetical protein n=1 Tax=Streptacidiphilus sp. EB129 TaxID=3156262 RepID=UPI00351457DE
MKRAGNASNRKTDVPHRITVTNTGHTPVLGAVVRDTDNDAESGARVLFVCPPPAPPQCEPQVQWPVEDDRAPSRRSLIPADLLGFTAVRFMPCLHVREMTT